MIARTSRGRSAMIVFVDHTECCWLRALARGFRHCFVVLELGPAWLACDSLKSHMELSLLDLPESFDLARYYANQGHHVLVGRIGSERPRTAIAVAPLTCVSVAKAPVGHTCGRGVDAATAVLSPLEHPTARLEGGVRRRGNRNIADPMHH